MLQNNLELIVGPVCSGKSAELIRRVDRYTIAGYQVLLVKPSIDIRSAHIKSRNGTQLKCVILEDASRIYDTAIDMSLIDNKKIDPTYYDKDDGVSKEIDDLLAKRRKKLGKPEPKKERPIQIKPERESPFADPMDKEMRARGRKKLF